MALGSQALESIVYKMWITLQFVQKVKTYAPRSKTDGPLIHKQHKLSTTCAKYSNGFIHTRFPWQNPVDKLV